jgi:hypothetical protein
MFLVRALSLRLLRLTHFQDYPFYPQYRRRGDTRRSDTAMVPVNTGMSIQTDFSAKLDNLSALNPQKESHQ